MELNIWLSLASEILSLLYLADTVSTLKVFRPLSSETYSAKGITETASPVVVRGKVEVASSPDSASRLFESNNSAVGAYVWRVSHSDNLYIVDIKNKTLSKARVSYEAGLEFEEFAITDGGRSARIDPAWLVRTHNSIPLSEVTISTLPRTISLSPGVWSSPYIHLTGDKTETPIEDVSDLISSNDYGGSHRFYLESKPIASETVLTVYGNVRIEAGTPVFYETDAAPLVFTDLEPADFRRHLTRRLAKKGSAALLSLRSPFSTGSSFETDTAAHERETVGSESTKLRMGPIGFEPMTTRYPMSSEPDRRHYEPSALTRLS
jgi:hypothetical protein